jgi:hypothetical protein
MTIILGYLLIGAIVMHGRIRAIGLEAALRGRSIVVEAALWVVTWPWRI